MIHRTLSDSILRLARKYPVVSITGPRQSGKTTLARHCFPDYQYVNLELPDIRSYAENDPRAFLKDFQRGLIIDEIQHVPKLFSYIQAFVDESGANGQYILTGSQNFLLIENISQTLAGRIAILRLLPFSRDELKKSPYDHKDLFKWIHTGFYPRIFDKHLEPNEFYPYYIQTYLERDVRSILNVEKLSAFRNFLGIAAGRTGQLVNLSSIANEIGVDQKTIKNWFSVLEASYIIFFVRPYHKNFNKRLVKSPKIYFTDTGLACSLLGIKTSDELNTHFLKGAMFENFILSELLKELSHKNLNGDMYFWRDNTGNEIDSIIEIPGGKDIIEIKSSQTISEDFFRGLDFFRKISGEDFVNYFLVYRGEESQSRSKARVISWLDCDLLLSQQG